MNTLFITSTLPRYADDGQAPFVLEQALAWKSAFPEDSLFILAPHDREARSHETIDGVTIKRFRYWWPALHQKLAYPAILPNLRQNPLLGLQIPALVLCEFLAARTLVEQERIDFIFAHWVMPQGLVAYLLHRRLGIPYGLKNYSSDLRVFRRMPWVGPAVSRRVIRASTRLICENSELRQEALGHLREAERARHEDKVVALSMGVFHGVSQREVSRPAPVTCDFAFIGRLTRKKGVDCFLRALATLHDEGIAFRAQIAGDGEERSELVSSCRIPDVTFLGHISGERKQSLFREARFFVFPSIESDGDIEGLPVSVLEALYSGKIVIASRATNIHLLPEWGALRAQIYLLEDPHDESEFTELLRTLLALTQDAVRDVVEHTQSVTSRFGWAERIGEYRRLLVGEAASGTFRSHRSSVPIEHHPAVRSSDGSADRLLSAPESAPGNSGGGSKRLRDVTIRTSSPASRSS